MEYAAVSGIWRKGYFPVAKIQLDRFPALEAGERLRPQDDLHIGYCADFDAFAIEISHDPNRYRRDGEHAAEPMPYRHGKQGRRLR